MFDWLKHISSSFRKLLFFLIILFMSVNGEDSIAKVPLTVQCAQKLCMVAGGVVCSIEKYARIPYMLVRQRLDLSQAKKDQVTDEIELTKRVAISSGRGPIEYADALRLHLYNFNNKQVLDIAAGKSRFAQAVNIIYGLSGTKATALDFKASAPLLSGNTPWVKADAFDMPFSDKSYDLTLNNWMFTFFVPNKYSSSDTPDTDMRVLEQLIHEQLRVTADGGEAHIGLNVAMPKDAEGLKYLSYILENHPRVESYDFALHFPIGKSLRVKMKSDSPEDARIKPMAELPDVEQLKDITWVRRGLWGSEIALAYGIAKAVGAYRSHVNEKYNERLIKLNDEFFKLWTEVLFMLQTRSSEFNFMHYNEFEKDTYEQDIVSSMALLNRIKELLNENPKRELKPIKHIQLEHSSSSPSHRLEREGAMLYLNTRKAPDLKSLLFKAP